MAQGDVLIGFVIDKSGSMAHLVASTVAGFNEFVHDQRQQDGLALMSLTLFDTQFDVRFVAEDLNNVPDLGSQANPYTAGGGTALYDAVGTTVKGIEAWLANHQFDGAVRIVILTDGQENSSKEWHIHEPRNAQDQRDLNNLIEYKQGEGWEFIFLGAGGSSWLEGNKFTSIPSQSVYQFAADPLDNAQVYAGMSRSFTNSRATGQSVTASALADSQLMAVASNRSDKNRPTKKN